MKIILAESVNDSFHSINIFGIRFSYCIISSLKKEVVRLIERSCLINYSSLD